ncbi:MAG: DUF3341 domain-containing protein [Acidobacteria bacterium]|nr:DUF3341 domain-containing protein [Acidobacteriota bacterium]MCB9397902.1 DUF3341 domain-containing protein [Acidobacteriota bacterium]
MSAKKSGVLAVYSHFDVLLDAVKSLRSQGHTDLVVYSPTPRHEFAEVMEEKPSPVRLFTLLGGLTGCTFGYVFTSFTSLDWILPTSGKAIVSPQAFTVIAFELTILFGSIMTIVGISIFSKLFRKRDMPYDERFTDDKFGIFLPCESSSYDEMSRLLRENGAEEISHD